MVVWAAWVFTAPLRSGGNLFAFAQDDLFLYLTVARNLARGLGSTFNGTTATNGYHPLYELLLWVFCRVGVGLPSIFRCLAALDVLSATAIFLLARGLFRQALAEHGMRACLLANGLALASTALCASLLCEQMEVTLTLPLALGSLLVTERNQERATSARWVAAGLVAALLTLSRLDAALFVGLCMVLGASTSIPHRAAFLAGSAPLVAAYLGMNRAWFGRWLPISAAAKQMRRTPGFAFAALRSSLSPAAWAAFAVALIALCLLAFTWRRLEARWRVVLGAALAFPFVHWGLLGLLSDWRLWGWYTYSLRIALVAALVLGVLLVGPHLRMSRALLLFLVGLVALGTRGYKIDPEMRSIAEAAEGIQTFAREHPGRYAMGDRGGMVAYAIDQPVVQLEGLMMDGAFLDRIRHEQPLDEVLRAYRTDFYIGFAPRGLDGSLPSGPCFDAREPAQAGPGSPVLRGRFCGTPALALDGPSGRTMIFDLRPQPPSSSPQSLPKGPQR